ncbi:wall-associated receptor kinase-like 20 isoform X2 [Cajanus cajan]|uniref:wall-associated receptor kinase-like 20 isoform X2 n=1 Tax=Cajanus cajan TaxID=3821 RepID=UPI0010FBBD9C|nr:wall-associated receptor kinase-like 20 isoform X2 [Cajanus cajan]
MISSMAGAAASLSTLLLLLHICTSTPTGCRDTCGSTHVEYPFGTGPGCGSPLFSPYITCASNGTGDQLFLRTHSASYPISSISYATATLTLTPPSMSTCASMHPSPSNFGLDWSSPFQIASSTFLLLSCQPSISLSSPLCDPSFDYLCAAIYACPAVLSPNMPPFPPTNTCCVYSPANLDAKGELDLKAMKCSAYASVMSLGDNPTDPTHWLYGIALKYSFGGALDNNYVTTKCSACQSSGGICGFAPPGNAFLCVCKGGYNTSLDCSNYNQNQNQNYVWDDSNSSRLIFTPWYVWSSILAGIILSLV